MAGMTGRTSAVGSNGQCPVRADSFQFEAAAVKVHSRQVYANRHSGSPNLEKIIHDLRTVLGQSLTRHAQPHHLPIR